MTSRMSSERENSIMGKGENFYFKLPQCISNGILSHDHLTSGLCGTDLSHLYIQEIIGYRVLAVLVYQGYLQKYNSVDECNAFLSAYTLYSHLE